MSGYALTEPYSFGRGFTVPSIGAAPAAGSIFTQQLDARWDWRLIACVFTLTTSASAANRYVTVEYRDLTGQPFCVNAAAVVVTANSTQRFAGQAHRGQAEWATNTDVLFPLEPCFLEGGTTLAINVAAIQAADTLTLIRFLTERFPNSPDVIPALEQ